MALVICENVSLRYDGQTVAENLHFTVEKGQYLCVVGENGSGKSTLIKGLLGLKTPAEGTIRYGDGLHRSEIGYLPQQTAAEQDFPASVREVVLSGRLGGMGLRPFYNKKDRELAEESMRRLGISELASRPYGALSGGQRQRVLLARALCGARRLLVLDEPVTGLDPVVTAELYQLVEKLNRQTGLAVVMVSHDISTALRYATHILHLQRTQLFFGTTADYVASAVGRAYLNESKA